MSVTHLFRQQATLRRVSGHDAWGEPVHDPDRTIDVRWTDRTDLVHDASGQEVVSNSVVSTVASVKPGDALIDATGRARRVVNVRVCRDLDGRLSHYVAHVQ